MVKRVALLLVMVVCVGTAWAEKPLRKKIEKRLQNASEVLHEISGCFREETSSLRLRVKP